MMPFRPALLAGATQLCLMTAAIAAEPPTPSAPSGSAVTVVTLYSETRPVPGMPASSAPGQAPIRIVNGGVRSAGDSCWQLSDTGQVTTQSGECYVLRSAEPGEKPPTH